MVTIRVKSEKHRRVPHPTSRRSTTNDLAKQRAPSKIKQAKKAGKRSITAGLKQNTEKTTRKDVWNKLKAQHEVCCVHAPRPRANIKAVSFV